MSEDIMIDRVPDAIAGLIRDKVVHSGPYAISEIQVVRGCFMSRIFIPTETPSAWQNLLAKPELHWKKAHSAMTAAACWESAKGALPEEVLALLESSKDSILMGLRLLAAFPEWKVDLPGGERPSATDVMALARNERGLVAIAVEAKVDEEFGPTLGAKRGERSAGQRDRIDHLHHVLRRQTPLEDGIRYQLLHRTASALHVAEQFHAHAAVMLVHSFSPVARWREDFMAFCSAMSVTSLSKDVCLVPGFDAPRLYLAWCAGNKKFLDVELPSAIG
jgi:hypothetical protein